MSGGLEIVLTVLFLYWAVASVFVVFYDLLTVRIDRGRVNKYDLYQALWYIPASGFLLPVIVVGEVLRALRWLILALFNIGAKK